MSEVTIYHNPRCSKSRQTLALILEHNIEPEIILYLENPPSINKLKELLTLLDKTPRELLRKSEDAYKENNLSDTAFSDTALIHAMLKEPKLIERPIVVSKGKAVLGRPPENVLEIL